MLGVTPQSLDGVPGNNPMTAHVDIYQFEGFLLVLLRRDTGACVFSREEITLWVHSCTKAAKPGLRRKVRCPLLTSSEHQAHAGLTARHSWQEWMPRVVQMLDTAKETKALATDLA